MAATAAPVEQTAESCSAMAGMAVQYCATAAQAPSVPASDTDVLAASIAAQSNAMAAQANNLTIIALIFAAAAIGWAWLVKMWAEKAARDAVAEWMDKNAYTEFSKVAAEFVPDWMDDGPRGTTPRRQPLTQEEMEKGLGGDPAKDSEGSA